MSRQHLYFVVAFFLIVSAGPLAGGELTVGSTQITFVVPADRCEVSESTRAGAAFFRKMRDVLAASDNTQLLVHADCDQFKRFSTGNGQIADYAVYMTPSTLVSSVLPADLVSRVCTAYKSMTSENVASLWQAHEPNIDRLISGIKIADPKFLGVLSEENNACYTGAIARVVVDGKEYVQAGIFAYVLVKGKYIIYSSYAPFRDSQSVMQLLTKHKAEVAALISSNTQ